LTLVKFKVEKGRTLENDSEVYTLEMEVDDSQLEETRAWAISTIDRWLEEMEPAREAARIPHLDTAELRALPFLKFKEKTPDGKYVPCGPDSPGWNFVNVPEFGTLVKAVKEAGGSLVVGEWKYELSGRDGSLIRRVPQRRRKQNDGYH